jgi:HlyD family secretion protein
MTANASILVAHKDNILRIPNAALRFRPDFAKAEASAPKGTQAVLTAPALPAASLPSLERLKAELNLSPPQQTAISHILADTQKEVQGAQKGSPETALAKVRQLSAFARSKIGSVLSEEQRKKFEQMPEQTGTQTILPKFKVWVPVPQKRPMPVEITTGISDGAYTEVLSGALQEGQEVILEAMGSSKGAATPASQTLPAFKGGR